MIFICQFILNLLLLIMHKTQVDYLYTLHMYTNMFLIQLSGGHPTLKRPMKDRVGPAFQHTLQHGRHMAITWPWAF